ncbi:hypothetical protein DY000_02059754 [Brassica cretica]|uniref:Uncharacterized protein n=1 Tax=Brassica cretica TaxID=69181 RepID=A0ABQ7ANV6_BRACR|nr:hypothetical protein DY000_02059754 [Brassica cretica]
MVPCADTQGSALVARTLNYRSRGTQGPALFGARRRGNHILCDDVIGRRNITCILSRISQPQPYGGNKKQLLLTRPLVRTAGNTMLTSVARFDAGITYKSLLVPADSSRSAKGTLPKRREHCCSTTCKGARENANTISRSAGLHILYSFGANGRKRSRRTDVSATIHPKEKVKPLGSGFKLPGSESQLQSSGSQLPTTLIPFFLAMYPDIPLKKTRPRGKHGQMI